jgi:threonine/homoserine/homoserine lactone efflux protein
LLFRTSESIAYCYLKYLGVEIVMATGKHPASTRAKTSPFRRCRVIDAMAPKEYIKACFHGLRLQPPRSTLGDTSTVVV